MSSRPTSSWAWGSASSPRWRSTRRATARCAPSTRATCSSRAPRDWGSSAAPTCAATPTSSSSCSPRICRATSSSRRSWGKKAHATSFENRGQSPIFPMLLYEVAHAREDQLAPAPSAEDAVVADAGRDEVLAPLARDVQAERVRRLGLPVPGNVVELAFDGEEGDVADRLRPHQLVAHEHATLRQREFLEHGFDRVEVVIGGHVEHGVVFIVEAPVRLGGFAVAEKKRGIVGPVR